MLYILVLLLVTLLYWCTVNLSEAPVESRDRDTKVKICNVNRESGSASCSLVTMYSRKKVKLSEQCIRSRTISSDKKLMGLRLFSNQICSQVQLVY